MYFHPDFGPPPTAGLELEVVRWAQRTMLQVARDLEVRGYMPEAQPAYSEQRHDYHCRCNMCRRIGSDIFVPPQWKMQRDASLPYNTGAEFISSPFPTTEMYIEHVLEACSVIGDRAEWTLGLRNERDTGTASPSLHITVHAYGPDFVGLDPNSLRKNVEVLYSFIPELFAIATANNLGKERPLTYRMPHLYWEQGDRTDAHHSWLGSANQNKSMFEWRLWEAAYGDEDYIAGAILVSAALSQFVFSQRFFRKFEGIAKLMAWDDRDRDMTHIKNEFSRDRFELLGDLIVNATPIKADPYSTQVVEGLLGRIR